MYCYFYSENKPIKLLQKQRRTMSGSQNNNRYCLAHSRYTSEWTIPEDIDDDCNDRIIQRPKIMSAKEFMIKFWSLYPEVEIDYFNENASTRICRTLNNLQDFPVSDPRSGIILWILEDSGSDKPKEMDANIINHGKVIQWIKLSIRKLGFYSLKLTRSLWNSDTIGHSSFVSKL